MKETNAQRFSIDLIRGAHFIRLCEHMNFVYAFIPLIYYLFKIGLREYAVAFVLCV